MDFDRLIITTQPYDRLVHWAKHGRTKRLRKKYHGRAFILIKGLADDPWQVIDSLRWYARQTGARFTDKCQRKVARYLRRLGWSP